LDEEDASEIADPVIELEIAYQDWVEIVWFPSDRVVGTGSTAEA
jgi:hypothetical protein